MKRLSIIALSILLVSIFHGIHAQAETDVTLNADIRWSPLNPARGDKSPQAGQLWGDRTTEGPSGFLVKFVDGFSSPPHIHNVTYKGVVISGLVHNDDPDAKSTWMPVGSFWTQPAGESHITSAKGDINIAYIEIENGPYLVQHPKEEFDNGERSINIDPTNLVWLSDADSDWLEDGVNAEISFLWGDTKEDNLSGSFVKLPAGFTGNINSKGSDFRAIVISGELVYEGETLTAGSYFGASEAKNYPVAAFEETILYIRTNGTYQVTD